MLKVIIEASKNFCLHQINVTPVIHETINKTRTLIAYIDLDTHDGHTYRAYIASSSAFMQRVSKLFLEEDESDEETLIDMTLETTNMIIGSAKVMLEEENKNSYTIGTPHFVKYDTFDFDFDEVQCIQVCGDELIVAIKELD